MELVPLISSASLVRRFQFENCFVPKIFGNLLSEFSFLVCSVATIHNLQKFCNFKTSYLDGAIYGCCPTQSHICSMPRKMGKQCLAKAVIRW